MEIHVSTQAGIVNYVTANEFITWVLKRVLARELEEIAEIRAKTPKDLEIECFVHGAMCVSFSGQMFASQYLVNRDAIVASAHSLAAGDTTHGRKAHQ